MNSRYVKFVRSRKRSRLFGGLLIYGLVMAGLLGTYVVRASGSWVQTTWDGGTGTSTTNQYESASNINSSTSGEVSVSRGSNLFSNTSFDSNITGWHGVNGAYDSSKNHSGAGSLKIVSPATTTLPFYSKSSTSIPTGTDGTRVLSADFNKDGLDDVVTLDKSLGKIIVYLNNGDGTFTAGTSYDGYSVNSYDMTVNDFNGDGYVDIEASGNQQSFVRLMNNGDGTFTRIAEAKLDAGRSNATVSADFDNDGDIDIMHRANSIGSNYMLYVNNGSGSFSSGTSFAGTLGNGNPPGNLVALDFNGDGFMDVAYPINNSGTCRYKIMLNNGGAGFSAEQEYTITYCNANGTVLSISKMKFNNDQYDDLVMLSNTSGGAGSYPASTPRVTIVPGTASGVPSTQIGYTPLSTSAQLTAFDYSGDGLDDVVVTNNTLTNYMAYTNNGDGTLAAYVTGTTGSGPNSSWKGDFNGDGKLDLITLDKTDSKFSTYINRRGGDAYTQSINVGDTSTYQLEAYAYTTGAAVTSADAALYANGQPLTTTYTDAGSGWYKLSAHVTGANAKRNYGAIALPGKTVYFDDISLFKYPPSGIVTSAVYDLGYGGDWGNFEYQTSGSGSVAVKVRTGNSSDMSDAPAFSTCTAIASGTDLTGQSCITNNHRYVQYQATLTPDANGTPVLESTSIAFSAWDLDPPSINASGTVMKRSSSGATIAENTWTNASTPYFSWTAGQDALGGSGIAGYCLSLGTDQGANPVTTKGLLGTSPMDTNGACQFAVSGTSIDLSTSGYLATALTTSNSNYYLAIKAIDLAGNVYGGSAEEFAFKFDNTPPTPPAFVTAPSQFVASKDVTLTWPNSGGDAANDAHSGLTGLQYRIGSSGTWYGDDHTGSQDTTDLLANDGAYTTVDPIDYDAIVEGNNIFYFRAIDEAGNISTNTTSTVLKINTGSPSGPQSVTATPSTNTTNSFAFSWNPPSAFTGQASNITYCYTINTLPTVNTCSFTAAGVTSLPAGAYATQPGENTFYVVAKDEAGNINYATAASTTFQANTSAPGLPLNADVVDISVKSTSNWRLALSWDEPTDVGAGVATYKIYRSVNNNTFSVVATTSGTSYVDGNLSQQRYYYKVAACDSANNCGAQTASVNELPTGKYTEPAGIVSPAKVTQISTRKATINWSTDRESDSRIQYGLIPGQYFATEAAISAQVTDHEVLLNNLSAGTTYYAKAKWTDEDGNTGQTSEFVFRTAPAPVVKEVKSTPTLTDSVVSFTSKDASKVKVYYGKSEGFGGLKTVNTSLSESGYTLVLDGLDDGSKYFYKLNALDEDGNEYEGNVYAFTTPPRPQISNLRFQPIEDQPSSTQKVTWTTNVATTSELAYGIGRPTEVVAQQQLGTNHEVTISGLIDDSTYVLQARSRDENGNLATSDQQVFKTDLDTRPPKMSDVIVDASVRGTGSEARGQVVVSWKTDEPSSSQVAYGEGSTGFLSSSTSEDGKLTTDHVVVVSDLSTSRVYHFEPRSFDRSRNQASGDQKVAIIGRASDNVLSIIFNSLQKIFGIN